MALKKGISYQWRLFVPVLIAFWVIIISMAWWQTHRVREIKSAMVFDQLSMVAQRIVNLYDEKEVEVAQTFIDFINRYYEGANDYDPMSLQVLKPDQQVLLSIGVIPPKCNLPPDATHGIMHFSADELQDARYGYSFLYYVTYTKDHMRVLVMLPLTREVGQVFSASTTRFWLVFFSIAILVTIFSYISSSYFSRNIKVLRNFAIQAAENPEFAGVEIEGLPHDELGEISRQIISLYRQRIEEFEKREREHQVALHAIEDKNRMKRELTSNINHELKTPVGVIQGYIDTIIDNPDMDIETRDRFLYKTQDSVHRLSSLIADITAITKLESGGRLVDVQGISFHDFIFTFANYLDESKVLAGKMTFKYDVPLDCVVLANESLLQAVILNLVKNAVAYSGGTECHLEFVDEKDGMMHFRFYDNGVGVPPEHLPHMFERFYRVNAGRSRSTGGTGLGLSIVEVTIQSFGGQIEVSNRHPAGLQFDFTLQKHVMKSHSDMPTGYEVEDID